MTDELWTPVDVSRFYNVRPATLRSWRHRGFGPPSFTLGGVVRYRRSAVEEWLAAQERADAERRVSA